MDTNSLVNKLLLINEESKLVGFLVDSPVKELKPKPEVNTEIF